PIKKAAAARKNKVLKSRTLLNMINTTSQAISRPDTAIFLEFTCMSKDPLPYIHRAGLQCKGRSTYFRYRRYCRRLLRFHSSRLPDTGCCSTGAGLPDWHTPDFLDPYSEPGEPGLKRSHYFPFPY